MDLLCHEGLKNQTSLQVRHRKRIIPWPEGQQTWLTSLKGPMIISKSTCKSNSFISNQSWDKTFFKHCCYVVHSEVMEYWIKCLAITVWALLSALWAETVFATRFNDSLCQQTYIHSYGQIVSMKQTESFESQHWFWNDNLTCFSFIYICIWRIHVQTEICGILSSPIVVKIQLIFQSGFSLREK